MVSPLNNERYLVNSMLEAKIDKILKILIKVFTFIISLRSKKNKNENVDIVQDENTNPVLVSKINKKIKEHISHD